MPNTLESPNFSKLQAAKDLYKDSNKPEDLYPLVKFFVHINPNISPLDFARTYCQIDPKTNEYIDFAKFLEITTQMMQRARSNRCVRTNSKEG